MKNPKKHVERVFDTIFYVLALPLSWMSHKPRNVDMILQQAGMQQMDSNFDKNRALLAGAPHDNNGLERQSSVSSVAGFSAAGSKGSGGMIDFLVRNDPIPLIHPDSMHLRRWQILLLLMIGFNILCVPYDLAFGMSSGGLLQIISYISDSVFLFDILITLHVKLCIEYQMDAFIVGQRDIIAKQYLYGNFWIDVLSIGIPFDAVDIGFKGFGLFKMLRLFRAIRIVKKIVKVSPDMEEVASIVAMVLAIMYVSHLVACLFWSCTTWSVTAGLHQPLPEDDDDGGHHHAYWHSAENGGMTHANANANANGDGMVMAPGMWARDGRDDLTTNTTTNFEQFMVSYYWAVMTISTVGYGDVSAVNELERSFRYY